jgi:hypothetical protein
MGRRLHWLRAAWTAAVAASVAGAQDPVDLSKAEERLAVARAATDRAAALQAVEAALAAVDAVDPQAVDAAARNLRWSIVQLATDGPPGVMRAGQALAVTSPLSGYRGVGDGSRPPTTRCSSSCSARATSSRAASWSCMRCPRA